MHPLSFLTGAGFGAGAMYMFDPQMGNRRLSLVRDQLIHACNQACKAADVVQRDAANRLYGTAAEVRAMMRHDDGADDVILARVRTKLGRWSSHPSAIEVDVADGCVRLSGPILANEVQGLVTAIESVSGVQRVENELDVHEQPGNISALQGGRPRTGEPFDLMQENWAPATRAAVGAAAVGLLTTCFIGRRPVGMLLGTIGLGLTMRALSNRNSGSFGSMGMQGQGGERGGGRADSERGQGQPQATRGGEQTAGRTIGQSDQHDGGTRESRGVAQASSPAQAGEPVIHDL